MFASFFESVKYVGHLLPMAFLRIFLGYYYLQQALAKFHSDFLNRTRLAATLAEALPNAQLPLWYKNLVEDVFIPHWQSTSFAMTGIEFAIAISYLLGYVVRPIGLLAALLSMHMLLMATPANVDFFRVLLACHLTMAWMGAGRCLGIDYFYYKRVRGMWW